MLLVSSMFAGSNAPAAAGKAAAKPDRLAIIKGIVRDAEGSPIAEASVAIFRGGTSKLLKQVSSGRDGSFLARVIPGSYTLLAVAQGFNPVTVLGVEVGRAAELTYGFELERAGGGNTLPEKRIDRNSSKWRIRAAQSARSIYQNSEGEDPVKSEPDADESNTAAAAPHVDQTVVETYLADGDRGSYKGVNIATLFPVGDNGDVIVAAQAATGQGPLRFETGFRLNPFGGHQLRLNASAARLGTVDAAKSEKALGQLSFQALDEWRVSGGIILVFGLDYSRFVGAGDDYSLSPRLGFQYDLNAKTRLRSAFTTQTEEKTWARALDLEGQSVAFAEPVAIEDLVMAAGKPVMNKSRRLEFGIERVIDNRSSVEANVFFDTTLGRGVGINGFSFDTLDDDGFGDFVANQQGTARGVRLVYTRRLNGLFSTAAGYSFGSGQRLSSAALSDPANVFENDLFHSFFGQLAADFKTGTSVRTIYRLSPEATVFAIDPFKGRLAIYDPGLSVMVTQNLPTLGLPFTAQAVVDARNIFDFQPGVSGEEGSLRLSSHRRMFRGGIQVRF